MKVKILIITEGDKYVDVIPPETSFLRWATRWIHKNRTRARSIGVDPEELTTGAISYSWTSIEIKGSSGKINFNVTPKTL